MPDLPVGFMHGNAENLPQAVQDGLFLFTDDTNKLYLDISGERHDINKQRVYSNTTAVWNAQRTLVCEKDVIYVYIDGSSYIDDQGNTVYLPKLKIGDGTSYLIDAPFAGDARLIRHINDTTIHVTPEEKAFWNNKVSVDESQVGQGKVIFTTQ